jgi:predicted adenine nucleotide alpha hydrolase (AANH) superfamily ATPase
VFLLKDSALADLNPTGYFYNPNIYPAEEYSKRRGAVETLAKELGVEVLYEEEDDPREFFERASDDDMVPLPHGPRCRGCYSLRLEKTARKARSGGFDAFTTTLLYSKYQEHDYIKEAGERIGRAYGVPFHYEDYRSGWGRGITLSKKMHLYRQKYCGCVYSIFERGEMGERGAVEKALKDEEPQGRAD